MSNTTEDLLTREEKIKWHYENCHVELENDPDFGMTAYCIEHNTDVTECLPEPIEPDEYDNSPENEGINA